ncbi:MAG: tetratricopeptide repeat protein [Pseudomonadota bacterium]
MTTSSSAGLTKAIGALALMALGACSTVDPPKQSASDDVTPLVADLHRDHGLAALQAERYVEAASYFQRILKDLPEDQQARIGLGEAYLGQGRLDEALVQFDGAEESANPAHQAKALQGQGIVLLRQGDQERALVFLEQAIEKDAGLWRSWNALGRLKDANKDYSAARNAFRTAIDLNPKSGLLHNNLGFSLLASGEPVYAEASLNRALELDPTLAVATTNLRLALALQGRYGPALAGASVKERAVVMNNVGYAALLRGDHQKAKSLFQDALAADPGFFGEAKRNLAFLETLVPQNKQER